MDEKNTLDNEDDDAASYHNRSGCSNAASDKSKFWAELTPQYCGQLPLATPAKFMTRLGQVGILARERMKRFPIKRLDAGL